jgi:hypothetical protein
MESTENIPLLVRPSRIHQFCENLIEANLCSSSFQEVNRGPIRSHLKDIDDGYVSITVSKMISK